MVEGNVRAILAAALIAAGCADPFAARLAAETSVSGEIRIGSGVTADGAGISATENGSYGLAKLGVDSSVSDTVKASAKASIASDGTIALERAYFKARIANAIGDKALRFSAGKSPLSWGRGFLLNAGDPIFGAIPASIGVGDSEYRTATDWIASAYVGLGDFSFIEAVELPPIDRKTNRAGGRLCVAPGWDPLNSVEAGYLYEQAGAHRAYVSLDGSLFIDYYGSLGIMQSTEKGDGPQIAVSAGALKIFRLTRDLTITARTETLTYPQYARALIYGLAQAGIGDDLSAGVLGVFAAGTESAADLREIASFAGTSTLSFLPAGAGFAGLTATWMPIKNIALSASALKRFEKGDPWKPEAIFAAGITCSF